MKSGGHWKEKIPQLKRRDLGLAGAIVVASQAASNFHSSQSVIDQLSEVKSNLQEAKVEREQYFVRKTDFNQIAQKIDKLSVNVATIKEKVNQLEKGMSRSYFFEEDESCDPNFEFKETRREAYFDRRSSQ